VEPLSLFFLTLVAMLVWVVVLPMQVAAAL
jgi:hypothetical protein